MPKTETLGSRPLPARAFVTCAVVTSGSYLLLSALLPNAVWFVKLWLALATGTTAGGIVTVKHWGIVGRRRGLYVMTLCCVSLVAALVVLPGMVSGDKHLRSLAALDPATVTDILIINSDNHNTNVANRAAIVPFIQAVKQARPFYPSHEVARTRCKLVIWLESGERLEYAAWIPASRPSDVALTYHAPLGYWDLIVPGLAPWLEAAGGTGHRAMSVVD